MEKIKKWRRFALALFSLLFVGILSFALVQIIPARADEEVLTENTAEYTFRDFSGEERGQAGYWNNTFFPYDFTYKPETNEWVSPTNYANIFGLELTVTKVPEEGNGVVAFQWKVNKLISDYPQMALTVKKISVGGEETSIVNGEVATEANVNTYTKVIVSELSKGDKVRIEFNKGNQAIFTIQGLNLPGKDIAMTAQIQEGDEQHGTIKTELESETVDENDVLTAKRGWGDSVMFTAEPQEGYAAVWYKVTGEDREFAGAGSVSLSKVSGSHNNLQLIARFIPKGGEPEVSFGTPSSKGAQWEKSGDRYTISNLTALERGEEVNLRVLTTSKYFKFTYAFAGGASASEFRTDHYSGSPSIIAYVDGKRWNNLSNTYEIGSESVETTCYVALPEGQAHIIEIEVTLSNSSRENPDDKVKYPISEVHEGCSVLFKDFGQMDAVIDEAPTIHFYYNPHLAELTINGQKVDQDDKSQTVDYEVHVKYMEEVTYSFQKRSNVISSIDGKTFVTVKYVDTTTNTSYNSWAESDLTSDPSSTTLSFWKTNAPSANLTKHYSDDYDEKVSANITDGSNELKIYQNYQEVNSLSPEVEVIQSINGETKEAQPISGDEVLEFPWAQNNALIINIKAYTNVLTLDNFLITVDGKPYDTRNMELSGDSYIFVITDVTNLSVSISYVTNGSYQFSGKTISFSAHESVEGSTIKDIVKTEELDIVAGQNSNMQSVMDWQFDPYRSEEGNYAYWGYLPSTTRYNTQRDLLLNLSMGDSVVEESGSISFEFQLKSYYVAGLGSSSYSGLLYYQANQEFSLSEYGTVTGSEDGCLILRGAYSGSATFLSGVKDASGEVQTNAGVVKQDNGWYRVNIPIQKGQTIYLAYFMGSGSFSGATDETWFSIRNLRLNTGTANVTLVKSEDSEGSVKATVDVQEHGESGSFTVAVGTAIDLEATPGSDERFYGWALNDGSVLSTEERFTYFAEKDCTITAYMAKDGTYTARIEGVYYKDLQTALTSAQENQTVTVVKNDLQITSNLTIQKGVTLLLPYNAAGRFMETGTSATSANQISWYGTTYRKAYITLTVKNNAKITVEGTLRVGGIVNDTSVSNGYQGHTSGAYSEIILEKGTSIQVANGGAMDVYGRVWGGTDKTGADMGTIDVAEGGKLYEPFLILDYTGGSNALACFTAKTTPFKRYAMVNIEVPLTINYGAQLFGHASLWVPSFNLLASLDQPFISYDMGEKLGGDGNGNDTFIMLHKGASVKITYNSAKTVKNATTANCTEGIGETTMIFEGGATFSYMLFSAMSLTVPTSPVVFSIPYNFQVEMNAGMKSGDEIDETYNQYETKTDFMIMPGATVKVGENATLTLNADTWVLDGYAGGQQAGKQYPSKDDLAPNYSASGNLIVNGTLKIGQKTPGKKFEINIGGSSASGGSDDTSPRPANFLGIIQTNGTTGRIEIPNDSGLSGKVWMGLKNADYFAYTTTARVWDKAHKCFGDLKAGHTYTAKDGDSFTLTELKYTNAEGGAEDQTLTLNSGMVGSWMIVHEDHVYDWKSLSEEEKNLDGAKYKELTRQCTELGCKGEEHHLLLKSGEGLSATYKGANFDEDDLVELFKEHFGLTKGYDYFKVDAQITNGSLYNAGTYSNNVTFTLTNGVFLNGENGTASEKLAFTIGKFNVADLDQAAIKNDLSGLVYDGTAKTPSLTLQADGLTGSVDHGAFEWSNNTNAGENTASVTIKGSGQNFEGTLTVNFSIAKATLTVEVVDKEKTYDGTAWENVEKATQTTDFTIAADGGKIYNSDDLGLALTVGEPSADVGDYTVTGAASNANYTVTVTEGTYKITRAPLTVKIESKSHTYGETAAELSYTLDGVQNGEESSIRALLSLKSDGAEQWKDVNQYNITAWYSDSEIKNTLEAKSDDVLKNYTVNVSGGENAYTVKQKSIEGATFTVTETYTYDKTEKKPTMSEIEVKWTGYSDTDHTGLSEQFGKFTVDSYQNNTDAGTAHLTVNATGNFTGTKKVDFTIGKATVDSITVSGEYAYTGAVQSDAVKSKIVVKSGELTLDTGDYTVTFDRNGEPDVKDAGTYTVTVELTNACKNYQLGEVTTATFEVAKADITIKADDQHTPKGEPILAGDALTWTVTNTAGGKGAFSEDDRETLKAHISVTTDADKDTVNSNYTITIKWSDSYEPANYTVTFVNGTYSVDDTIWKYVSVTGAETIKYDGTAHTLTVEVNNEELNGKTTVTQTIGERGDTFEGATNVGTYEVTVTITARGYTSSFTGKYTITITAREVTVTFDAKSSVYGNAVETNFTYQTSGDEVLDGDNETFKAAIVAANPHTTATNTSGVDGSYTITTDKTPELDNYTITVKDGVYTITARAVDVTVNKQTVTYNQKPQSASSDTANWSVTNLAGGDEATVLNVELTAEGTNAGSYDITATWSNNNYAVTFKGADGLTVEQGNKVKNAFVIEAAELTDATVTGSYTYNGQTQTPTFNVKAGELTVAGSDFELEFAADADRVSAGTVQVTVKAKGSNYKGSLEKSFTIAAKKIKVTLNAQTADYSGEVPTPDNKAYTVNDGDLCSQNGVKDDLGVTITLVKGDKNVGSYGLDATASNENYEVEFDKTAQFTVTKKQITVKADDLKSFYGDDLKELTYTAKGLVEGEDAKTVLSITLEPERTIKEVGAYTIRGTGSAENYAFDKVEEGTYTVEKREVTVTINDQSSLYDGTEPEVVQGQGDGWTVPDGSIIAGDNLFIVLTKAEGADAAEYAISGAFRNDNYNVTFKGTMGEAGKFTIRARQLTVEIHDQSETYDHEKAQKQYDKEYKFNGGAWSIVLSSGDGLADGETREMLEISLQVAGTLSNAGKYAIAGECGNTNYAVTFTGNYDEDGEYKGTAGLYTIEKLDVSEEAAFMLSVKDGSDIKTEEGGAVVRVKFAGKAIELVCETTLLMGEDSVELATKLSRESIGAEEGIGSYEITVTIDDVNYCGQAVITVIVTDANGYTQRLKDVLAQLGTLTAELDKEHLKAEDYTVLLEVVKALGSLDEEERKVGAEELAEYEEYVTAWEELADIGEVIETAKTVANAPIAALFEAAATLTALAGLAYIAFKGGML